MTRLPRLVLPSDENVFPCVLEPWSKWEVLIGGEPFVPLNLCDKGEAAST